MECTVYTRHKKGYQGKIVSSWLSDKKVRDIIFVYGLMALALEDKANEARGKLQRYDLALTYMDEMPTKDDEVLGFAYGGSSRLPDCSQIVV